MALLCAVLALLVVLLITVPGRACAGHPRRSLGRLGGREPKLLLFAGTNKQCTPEHLSTVLRNFLVPNNFFVAAGVSTLGTLCRDGDITVDSHKAMKKAWGNRLVFLTDPLLSEFYKRNRPGMIQRAGDRNRRELGRWLAAHNTEKNRKDVKLLSDNTWNFWAVDQYLRLVTLIHELRQKRPSLLSEFRLAMRTRLDVWVKKPVQWIHGNDASCLPLITQYRPTDLKHATEVWGGHMQPVLRMAQSMLQHLVDGKVDIDRSCPRDATGLLAPERSFLELSAREGATMGLAWALQYGVQPRIRDVDPSCQERVVEINPIEPPEGMDGEFLMNTRVPELVEAA